MLIKIYTAKNLMHLRLPGYLKADILIVNYKNFILDKI